MGRLWVEGRGSPFRDCVPSNQPERSGMKNQRRRAERNPTQIRTFTDGIARTPKQSVFKWDRLGLCRKRKSKKRRGEAQEGGCIENAVRSPGIAIFLRNEAKKQRDVMSNGLRGVRGAPWRVSPGKTAVSSHPGISRFSSAQPS